MMFSSAQVRLVATLGATVMALGINRAYALPFVCLTMVCVAEVLYKAAVLDLK